MKLSLNKKMQVDEQCLTIFERMFVSVAVEDKVELKKDVARAARKVLGEFAQGFDLSERSALGDALAELQLYTSKHLVLARRISNHWRRLISRGYLD